MKRMNALFIFTFLLTLTSCMPDSLTKFEEKSTKKQKEASTSGGTTQEESVEHISSVYYNQATGQKLVLKLSSSAEYTLDGYVSAKPGSVNGVTAKINYLEGSNIYAEITTATITEDTTTFQKDTPIDNVEEYFSEEGTVSEDIIYTFSLGENIGDSALGFFPHFETTSSLDADDFTFELTPSLGNFASSGIYFVSKGTCYVQSSTQFPACKTAACTPTGHSTKSSCLSNGNTWAVGGTIHGTPTKAVQATSFALTVTDPNGNSTSTNFQMSLSEPPKGLSYSRNLLLHVPSASAFTEDDAISSSSGGEGTILGKFTVGATTAEHGIPELDYIEVKVIKGEFKELDDIDNNARYGAQKTYILGGGVHPYSAKVKLTTGVGKDFRDPMNINYNINENKIIYYDTGSGAIKGRARIKYFDKAYGSVDYNLYLSITDEGLTTPSSGAVVSTISQTDQINTENFAVNIVDNVERVYSNNVVAVLSGNLTNSQAGFDVTANPADATNLSDPTAMINLVDTNSTYYLSLNQGFFINGDSLDSENPYNIADGVSISSVSTDKAFYLYRGDEAIIIPTIDTVDTSLIKYTIDTALPPGLSLNEDTGVISGSPTDAASTQAYILTASSPYGKSSYSFDLKVNDQIIIRNKTDSYSYIMHRGLQGKQRVKCRVTEDQIATSAAGSNNTVNDIHCFLDVGEAELYTKGVNIQIDIGADFCQQLSFSPYFTNQFKRGTTKVGSAYTHPTNSNLDHDKIVYKHTGATETCLNPDEVNFEYTIDANPRDWRTPTPDRIQPVGYYSEKQSMLEDSPKYLCEFDHNLRSDDYPNCDSGKIEVHEVTWTQDSNDPPNCTGSSIKQIQDYDCGGSQSNCVAGPALDIMGAQAIDDGLLTKISSISAQAQQIDYTFKAPIENTPIPYSTNLSIANYASSGTCQSTYTVDSDAIANYGKYLKANDIFRPMTATNPIYRFNCTNGSGESKAFINLYIREWNEAFTASDDIDMAVPTSLIDTAGAFGLPNSTTTPNDRGDYNDILTGGDICNNNATWTDFDTTALENHFVEDSF